MSSYRRWFFVTLLVASGFFCFSKSVVAQPAAAPAPASNSQPMGRSYYVEGGVVVLLIAAAGYAVGRSSRRT